MDLDAESSGSLFTTLLGKIKEHLGQQDKWQAPHTTPLEVVQSIVTGSCNEFHFKWSALQFVDCLPPEVKQANLTSEHMFGDGLYWGGEYSGGF